jgi:hypothetical protein
VTNVHDFPQFGLLVLSLSVAAGSADAFDGHGIPLRVVHTWQDLLDEAPIALEDGSARLGISASKAPCSSGVVLYCLTEGYAPPSEWTQPNRLGPFQVQVSHAGDPAEHVLELVHSGGEKPPNIGQATVLFRQAIPLDRRGPYRVRVLELDGASIAEAEIRATRDTHHPWMPFERGSPPDGQPDRHPNDAVGFVRNRSRGIAIPRFDGMQPLVFRSDGPDGRVRRLANERLPTLVPAVAGEGLTIKATGSGLIVESEAPIVFARPDWHFLARWWVNGQPYVPRPLEPSSDQNGRVILGRILRLDVDFAPDRIGAMPGDSVDIQLLYCKHGWQWIPSDRAMQSASHEFEGPEMLLSNRTRIEW